MIDFYQLLKNIEKEYNQLDNDSKRELAGLMKTIHKYVVMNPEAAKIKTIRNSIRRRMRQEIVRPLGADKMGFWTLQRLRNQIIHNQKMDNEILLNFGTWMWNKFSEVYYDEPLALYNTLVYVIQPEKNIRNHLNTADQTALSFYDIYKSRSESERIAILRTLIPLVTPKFKTKYGNSKRDIDENSLK
jgi:hypothetical protein